MILGYYVETGVSDIMYKNTYDFRISLFILSCQHWWLMTVKAISQALVWPAWPTAVTARLIKG